MNRNKRREQFFRYAPLLLWIGVVLFASTGSASMAQTSRFIRPLLEILFPNSPEETLNVYHAYIRKLAHFTEYAILAFWATRAFSYSSRRILQNYWFVFSLLLVASVASIDETNQSFLISRTGSIYDVLLDVCGGLTMIIAFRFYKFISRNRK